MAITSPSDGTGFKQDLRGLGQDVATIGADVKHLAQDAVGTARSGANELRHSADHAVDAATAKLEEARKLAVDTAHSLKDILARHPVASISVIAGVGLLVGLLISRPRS